MKLWPLFCDVLRRNSHPHNVPLRLLLSLFLLIPFALMTTACSLLGGSESVPSFQTSVKVDIPPLSATAQKGGSTVPWPTKGTKLDPRSTTPLLTAVRASEVVNARAANACKVEYGNLVKLYGGQ